MVVPRHVAQWAQDAGGLVCARLGGPRSGRQAGPARLRQGQRDKESDGAARGARWRPRQTQMLTAAAREPALPLGGRLPSAAQRLLPSVFCPASSAQRGVGRAFSACQPGPALPGPALLCVRARPCHVVACSTPTRALPTFAPAASTPAHPTPRAPRSLPHPPVASPSQSHAPGPHSTVSGGKRAGTLLSWAETNLARVQHPPSTHPPARPPAARRGPP